MSGPGSRRARTRRRVGHRFARRVSRSLLAALAAAAAAGCGRGDAGPRATAGSEEIALDSLRTEVGRLRGELDDRLTGDSLVRSVVDGGGDVVLGVSTRLVTRVLDAATRTYLDEVRLHLEPGIEVEEGDEVEVRIGPVRVSAGRWTVRVIVERIEAVLTADTVELSVAGDDRIEAAVPVRVHGASGTATIVFSWDATTAASVVCRDFAVRESFLGTVAPYTERLEAALVLEAEGARVVARPRYTGRRLSVRPEPTPAAWRRVREILERQNNIFRCGLALSPDDLEARLRRLLRRGFRFEFPESVLQPVELPTGLTEEVEVEGRSFTVAVRPVRLRLDPDWLWYAADVELIAASR